MDLTNKTVVVTGADGFIGSHLTEKLVEAGAKVKALSYYNSFNSWGWLDDSHVRDEIEVVTGDIRDPDICNQLAKNSDIIFHLAALIAIPYSYRAAQSYIDTNVTGTRQICQAALDADVSRVLITSTSEVYGTARQVPIREDHPLQPQSPYSASKIAADAIAASYYHSFELPLVTVRPFNTYGPRQSARAVIPTIISQIASGKTEIKLGDLRPTRDFNYVTDTALGFLALAGSDKAVGQTVNIGSGKEITIGDLVLLIANIMQRDITVIEDQERIRPKASEVERLLCDNSLMTELTGFKHQHDLRQGLTETIKWFSQPQNLAKYKTDIYNV